jgi:hypothetical protein
MVLTLSKAAQIVYAGDSSEAYEFLSSADRFFRYHASSDELAPLAEELAELELLGRLDPSLGFRFADGEGELRSSAAFVKRLSLIDAVTELSFEGGEVVLVGSGGRPGMACRAWRGGSFRDIPCA